ncbi:carbohydrate ABC transporter substrate-binding protein, CUT1 family [Haladaptatus litoreus]|uniref:Carbohydrate ABC transporter substrate-binding protein, CUT1 family n=1 Tax=Haladaptatus litoreus TaxID=553468 RepID=A0A1N7CR16_9EURY|nr:ABC transporter substrate-binding protein [Haladaptatus litoreus]SIR66049.1 carbohydrate ABC transporter substrate-binding protein, CUT1 family [Haladaptatus litoreus]
MTRKFQMDGIDRRKFVTTLATAGTLGIAGCSSGGSDGQGSGGGGGSASNPTSLTVTGWSSYEDASGEFKQLVNEYDQNHDDVKTEYSGIVSKYEQKLKTEVGSGNAPDVFWLDSSYFASFADSDVLLNLQSLVDSGYTDDIFDPLMEVFNYEGTQYGIPKDFNTLQMFYNKDHFEQAGISEPPKTWSEFRTALEKIKQNVDGVAPLAVFANARLWWAMVFQNGGRILSKDGSEAVLASDANVEALQFLVDLSKDGLAKRPDQTGTDWHGPTIGEEKAAVTTMGAWGLGYLGDNHPEVDKKIDIAHLPIPEGGQKSTTAYVVSYSAYANTKNPDATKDLLKHLTSAEAHEMYASGGGVLTPRKSQQDSDYYNSHPRLQTFLKAGEWSKPWSYGPKTAEIINRVNPELEGAMLGKKSPRKALETAQQKINSEVMN